MDEKPNTNGVTTYIDNTLNNADPGTEILSSDINAYMVWIPRFKYKIFNPSSSNVSKQIIEVEFEDKSISPSKGTTKNTYKTHQAFTYNDEQVNGYWIGKFEITGTASSPTVKPNVASLNNTTTAEFYTLTSNFKPANYNNANEFRIMKLSEFTADSILSMSKYGISSGSNPGIVTVNNNSNHYTGCGTSKTSSVSVSTTCENAFGTVSLYPQSSTGNITGVFDMAGGSWKSTMTFETKNGKIYTGYNSSNNSGFNGLLFSDGEYTSGINLPNKKYYELMPDFDEDYTNLCSGGLYEGYNICGVNGWENSLNAYTIDWYEGPILTVGGGINTLPSFTSIFTVYGDSGNKYEVTSSRVVQVIK